VTKIAYRPLVAICLVVACGAKTEVESDDTVRNLVSATNCAAAAKYRVSEDGFFHIGSDSQSPPISPTWGEVDSLADQNGASSSRVAALLEGRSVGHVEVDDRGRAVLVVLDSLVSTSEGVSVASSVACITSLWREVRTEAGEGGVLIWRDGETRISYRLDRVLLPGNERDPVESRLNPQARVAAVLISLDSVPISVRSRLAAPD
jgi:hypothetical protein